MKTINAKNNISSIIDKESGKRKGFFGNIVLDGATIYVDTRSGTGYEEIINKLTPFIEKMAAKYKFEGNAKEDTAQDIIVHILEGIPEFNPDKGASLFTFLYMRTSRLLINDIRNKTKKMRNASFLNTKSFDATCSMCRCKFFISDFVENDTACPACGKIMDDSDKYFSVAFFELDESAFSEMSDSFKPQNKCRDNSVFEIERAVDEKVIGICDMKKIFKKEDPKMAEMLDLICFSDYSVKDAAKKLGMTSSGLYMKLRSLRKKSIVREFFKNAKRY